MDIKGNIIYFDNDNEFYDFAVIPQLITKDGDKSKYFDFELSPQYHKALKEGKKFCIKDEDSKILKHAAVSYRTITKDIENLEPWFEDDED